jgi:cytoskeletal protein RodZ
MSQVTHPAVSSPLRSRHVVALSALLALMALTAVVLILAIDGGSSSTSSSVAQQSQPATASTARPDESAVAASIDRTAAPATAVPPRSKAYVAGIGH